MNKTGNKEESLAETQRTRGFMKSRIIHICIFITTLTIFVGCLAIKKNGTTNNQQNNITDFFFVEIMNGNRDLSFHREKYEVIDMFGEPLDINVTEVSFNLAGGRVIEKRELIYDDFIHIYYVFEDGTIFYEGFIIEKRLERLKTINIGDTSDKLLSTFSDTYYTWDENISFYTDPVICVIQFVIQNTVIQKIFVSFLLI